jgi:hypothetical protein
MLAEVGCAAGKAERLLRLGCENGELIMRNEYGAISMSGRSTGHSMPLMFLLRRSVVGLIVMSCMAIGTPASARDRPGTPTDPKIWQCEQPKMAVCLQWTNTAKGRNLLTNRHDEFVGFEIDMTKNGVKYGPKISCHAIFLKAVELADLTGHRIPACYTPGVFEYHYYTPEDIPHGPHDPPLGEAANDVGFTFEADPNTTYCFKVRARRKSDQVVSAVWSGTSCVTTGAPAAAAAPPPPPPGPPEKPIKHTGKSEDATSNPPGGVLSCQGGGGMQVTGKSETGEFIVFTPAAQPASTAPPGPGQCAWADRLFAANEQHRLAVTSTKPNSQQLLQAVQGGTFQVTARPMRAFIMVDAINNVQVSGNAGTGEQADAACGAGTATVVINQAGLDKLNVRSGPDGQVTGTVPEGATVSVSGPCGGTGGAAGIIAKKESGGTGGWCRISAPVSGCVSAQFLKFGGGAAGFVAKPKAHQNRMQR